MRILTIAGAFLVSLGLLLVLLVAADVVWTIFTHGRIGADMADLLWMVSPLALLVPGGALLAFSYLGLRRARQDRPE